MRFKVVPPVPDSLDALREAREAVPRVPKPEDDCCLRVVSAGVTGARDEAKEWLTFGRALGLVAESDRGYHRAESVEEVPLGERFRERVFGAEELLSAVEERGSVTAEGAFEAVRERVPAWERQRHDDFETVWRERVDRLLGWAVLFGLLEHDGDVYRVA